MSDKNMPTNIHIGHVSRSKGRVHVGGCSADNQPDWVKKDPEYTLVHNNPEYHVIKKSDVDGDVIGALDKVFHYLGYTSWKVSDEKQKDVFIALKSIRNSLIAQFDPEIVRIPRKVLERLLRPNISNMISDVWAQDFFDNVAEEKFKRMVKDELE